MVLRGRKTTAISGGKKEGGSHPVSVSSTTDGRPASSSSSSSSSSFLYRLWIVFCLLVLIGLGFATVNLLNENDNINDDYPFVSSQSLTQEELNRWDPDKIRNQHELQYKQARLFNRTVCIDRTQAGECAPVWCDKDYRPRQAAWTGHIVHDRRMLGSTSSEGDEQAEEEMDEEKPLDSLPLHSLVMKSLLSKEIQNSNQNGGNNKDEQAKQSSRRKPKDDAYNDSQNPIDSDTLDCAVSEEFQFIFIHTLRSGGSAIKLMLREALCNEGEKTTTEGQLHCDPKRLRLEPCHRTMTSLFDSGSSPPSSKQQPQRQDYKLFTFVRNSYSRWLSIYTMGVAQSKFRNEAKSFPLTLEDFLQNPLAMARYTEPPMNSLYWLPQTHFFLDQRGCPLVDWIGHLETLEEDFQFLLEVLNRPPPLVRYWEHKQKQKQQAEPKKLSSYRKQAQEAGAVYDERALSEYAIELIQQRSIAEIGLLGYGSHYPFY